MDILKMLEQEAEIISVQPKKSSGIANAGYSWAFDKKASHALTSDENARDKTQNETAKLQNKKPVTVIALCGESAAGKTTLLTRLKDKNKNIGVISADNYYKDISDLLAKYGSFTRLVESGYDAESASAFQMSCLVRDIKTLKQGQGILMPFYDMTTGKSVPEAKWFQPEEIVIIEGICTFYEPIRDLFDIKIYLQADKERQKRRYFERATERGQNPNEIRHQFELVCLAAQKNIIPNQKYADLIVKLKPENTDINLKNPDTSFPLHKGDEKTLKERIPSVINKATGGKDTAKDVLNKALGEKDAATDALNQAQEKTKKRIENPPFLSRADIQKTGTEKSEALPHFTSVYDPKLWAYYLGGSYERH